MKGRLFSAVIIVELNDTSSSRENVTIGCTAMSRVGHRSALIEHDSGADRLKKRSIALRTNMDYGTRWSCSIRAGGCFLWNCSDISRDLDMP